MKNELCEIRLEEKKGIKRIIIGSENEYNEFSQIFSIDKFFQIWTKDNKLQDKYNSWIKKTYEGENDEETVTLKRIHRIFFLGIKDVKDGPFINKRYIYSGGPVSHFTSGIDSSDARRSTYRAYLLNNNIEKEIKRQEKVLDALFEDVDDEYIQYLKEKLDIFFGEKPDMYDARKKGHDDKKMQDGISMVNHEGFFDILGNAYESETESYRVYKPSYYVRFNERYKKNPLNAVARAFVLLLVGGYAFYVIDDIFNNMGEISDEEIQGEYWYNRFKMWFSKIVKPYNPLDRSEGNKIYDDAVKMYQSKKKTVELYYVMGKIRKEIRLVNSHFDDEPNTSNPEDCTKFLFDKCIECGESKNEKDFRSENEKNYLGIIAKASYEMFDMLYKNSDYSISEETRTNIRLYLEKSAKYNHSDGCNIIGDLLIIDYIEDFEFGNKYAETINKLKSWNIDFSDSNGEGMSTDIEKYKTLNKAIEYFKKSGDGHAYLRIAQCLEEKGESSNDIMYAWAEAYKRGEYDAKKKIKYYFDKEKNIYQQDNETASYVSDGKKVCILCSCSEENIMFAKSLPNDYKVIIVKSGCEPDYLLKEISKMTEAFSCDLEGAFNETKLLGKEADTGEEKEEEIIIVDYGMGNKNKCEHLEYIFSYVKLIAQRYDDKYFISERIKLCIDLDESMTELHIDRLERELDDIYIPVYDNMYEKNASIELLSKIPLFSMNMGKSNIKNIRHIVVLGSSKVAIQILKDIVSVCVADKSVDYYIHLVDSEADTIKKIMICQCNDLVEGNNSNYKLEFNTVDKLEYLNAMERLEYTVKDDSGNEIENSANTDFINCDDKHNKILLGDCDYYVCATDEDMLNIELAKNIRTWGLRYTKNYFDLPYIAVLNKDKNLSESLEGLTISTTRKIEYPWFEGLNLISFGALQDYFSYYFIKNNWVKGWGMSVHLAYCNREESEERHLAYNDFYSRWYNRDSSYMSALFFIYRFYNAGMLKEWYKWDFYRFIDEISRDSSKLLEEYNRYIQNPERKEEQAKMEHARWCEWMKSRGWTKPEDYSKVEEYMRAGNGNIKHQLYTAKIHPYILSWDDLGQRIIDKVIYELEYLKYRYSGIIGIIDSMGLSKKINNMMNELNEFQEKMCNEENNSIKKKIKYIIDELRKDIIKFDEIEEKESKYYYIIEYLQICINRLNEIISADQMMSTGLQAKMERWYKNYLSRPFIDSTKGHNLMIVSRTSEFIEYGRRIVEEKIIN